ncbi:MAG: hypothetical protein MZV65_10480 [Chromatiales bacterium]|nr:hypothetical protein [Chromatiales bacterium]
MQGVPGVVRTGGDGLGLNIEGPPPTEELLAYHSGIVKLDDRGRASVSVELPDFNGTVRVMAMAWSAEGVGHAVRDLTVRDPIVVTPTLPRFLAPGDRSRLLLGLDAVEGPSGEVGLSVVAEGDQIQVAPESARSSLTLAEGERGQSRRRVSGRIGRRCAVEHRSADPGRPDPAQDAAGAGPLQRAAHQPHRGGDAPAG